MKEQFTDYETAKMLKELGFNQPCYARYNDDILGENACMGSLDHNTDNADWVTSAPLYQQAEQWLWEKKIYVNVSCHKGIINKPRDFTVCSLDVDKKEIIAVVSRAFDSPITAKTEGIKQAIKHLHSKK